MTETAGIASVKVNVEERAWTEIAKFMDSDERRGKALRVVIAGASCSGPSLGLVLDEPNDAEALYENGGIRLLADKDLQSELRANGGLRLQWISHPLQGEGVSLDFGRVRGCGSGCCG